MNYLVIGSKNSFKKEFVDEAMESLNLSNKNDSIMLTSSVPVEDHAAEFAYKNKMDLITEDPDPGLHGNAAREYSLRKLAKDANAVILFYQDKKDQILKISEEIAIDFSLQSFQFKA